MSWTEEWHKSRQYKHKNIMGDLELGEPNDYKLFLQLNDKSDELQKIVTLTITKRNTDMQESHSQSAFIHYATLLDHRKYFRGPEIQVLCVK